MSNPALATALLLATSPVRPGAGEPGRCRVFGAPPEDDGSSGGTAVLDSPAVAKALGDLTTEVKATRAASVKVGEDLTAQATRLKAIEDALEQRKREIDAIIKGSLVKQSLPGYDPNASDDPAKRFSMARALLGHWAKWGVSDQTGQDTKKFIEHDLCHDYANLVKTQSGTVASEGGILVGVQMMPTMVELLRPNSVAQSAGVRLDTGATGNEIIIPKELTAITVTRDGEAATISESSMAFGDITLRRKRMSGLTSITQSLLRQTSGSIQGIVERSMARSLALKMDLDFFKGAGAGNTPLGVVNTAGIGSVTFSAIDYLGADQTVTDLLDQLQYKLKAGDAWLGRPTFFTNPLGTLALRGSKDSTGRPLFYALIDQNGQQRVLGGAISVQQNGAAGNLHGLPLFESTQLAGSASGAGDLILLNVDDGLMVLWDTIEVVASEHFLFNTGKTAVRILAYEDSALLRGASAAIAASWTLPA